MNKRIIIIGSGPAGYTSALYTSRGDLDTTIFAGPQPGGQLTTTTVIDNFPGFPEGIEGPLLMDNMRKQCEKFGTKILQKQITKVNFNSNPKKVWVGEEEFEADAIIIATGARSRMLNLPREKELFAKGVHTCATCDGFFYKDLEVAIVGGGDSAMEESQFLSKFAKKVYLIHRKDEFRASKIMQKKVKENPKIEILYSTNIIEYLGENQVKSIKIKNLKTEEEKELNAEGVFMAIGHIPNTEIFEDQVELTDHKTIKIENNVHTSIEGVFAAGDCVDHVYRQAITSAGLGCMAAIATERWLETQ